MAENLYQLVVRRGRNAGQAYPLTSVIVTIGRDPMADITISDPEVSRQHAQLIEIDQGYQIQDLGSTNGTFVEGKRLGGEPVTLVPGQQIGMGSSLVLVYGTAMATDEIAETMLDVNRQTEPPPPPPSTVMEAHPEPEAPAPVAPLEQAAPIEDFIPASEPAWPEAGPPEAPAPQWQPASAPVERSAAPVEAQPRRRGRFILAIFLILLLGCCAVTAFMYYWGGDWLLRQAGLLP